MRKLIMFLTVMSAMMFATAVFAGPLGQPVVTDWEFGCPPIWGDDDADDDAAELHVITANTPVASAVVANAQDVAFANIDLDATWGDEDVKVTSITVADILGNGADYGDLLNLELWGDPDNTDYIAQNVLLETVYPTAINANTVTFTFLTPIKVSRYSVSRLTLKADVSATPADIFLPYGTHTLRASQVIATGWTTGQDVTETYIGSGQAMSTCTSGILMVTVSPDRPVAAQYVAGATNNTVMAYKFSAAYEDIMVGSFYVATSGATASSDVARVKLYINGAQIGAAGGYTLDSTGATHVVLNNGEFVVLKDCSAFLTIKVDLADKSQLTDGATMEIGLGDSDSDSSEWGADGAYADGNYKILAFGDSSGGLLPLSNIDSVGDGTGQVAGSYAMHLYDGILTAALDPNTPSGAAMPGVAKEVLRLRLTAVGDYITVDDIEFMPKGTCNPTGTSAMYLKSADMGTTYATWPAGTVWLNQTDFHVGADGWDTTLEIAPGETRTVVLIADTVGCTTNEVLQVEVGGASQTVSGVVWQDSSGNPVDSLLTKNLPINGGTLVY